VPVYDEERRLGSFLETLGAVAAPAVGEMGLELVEVVVVDDGSRDRTPAMIREAAARDATFAPLLRGGHNEGKGAALRAGAAAARGDYTLFVDVDMSTPLSELEKLWGHVREGADMAIGSRDVTGSVVVSAPQHRKQIGRTFNLLVRGLTGLPFKDTQCGFKLMRTDTARTLLEHQLVSGYAFDVELLMRARANGLRVDEVPVTYVHDSDSRVNPLTASPRMALDLMRLVYRLRLRRGR
jgi:dolichyl-phosphate beta-glucosyltransferase